MAWFFRKRDAKGRKGTSESSAVGSHRSPGLELVVRRLQAQPAQSILDLGASTTENVAFLSRFAHDVMVVGLFRSCSDPSALSQPRARSFRFDERCLDALPQRDDRFAVVLLWDLLAYFEPTVCEQFMERLQERLEPGALIHLLAANHAATPQIPFHFRIEPGRTVHGKLESCGLEYSMSEVETSDELHLRTRDVEQRMQRFEPLRLFQLRNGFQEFVFRNPGERPVRAALDLQGSETPEPEPEPPAVVMGPPAREASAEEPVAPKGSTEVDGNLAVVATDGVASDQVATDSIVSAPAVSDPAEPEAVLDTVSEPVAESAREPGADTGPSAIEELAPEAESSDEPGADSSVGSGSSESESSKASEASSSEASGSSESEPSDSTAAPASDSAGTAEGGGTPAEAEDDEDEVPIPGRRRKRRRKRRR